MASADSCVQVGNVVCTFDAGAELNLKLIAHCLSGRFDQGVFPALVSYCKESSASIQIFATGKVVIVGCRTENAGLGAAHLLIHTLSRVCGIHDIDVYSFHVRNIVCSVRLQFELNLSLLYEDLTTGKLPHIVLVDNKTSKSPVVYKPDRFPGIAFPVETSEAGLPRRITFALFDSGNGVATGLKALDQVRVADEYMKEHMWMYERGREYRVQDARHVRRRKEAELPSKKKKKKQKL
jgi:TATA-box binding protein (TBP) (component of TFIID and TFIIIB)